jgi:hypothetical protein
VVQFKVLSNVSLYHCTANRNLAATCGAKCHVTRYHVPAAWHAMLHHTGRVKWSRQCLCCSVTRPSCRVFALADSHSGAASSQVNRYARASITRYTPTECGSASRLATESYEDAHSRFVTSVCPHQTRAKQLNGFSRNSILVTITTVCQYRPTTDTTSAPTPACLPRGSHWTDLSDIFCWGFSRNSVEKLRARGGAVG